MARCQDCHWFNNPLPAGRRERTCAELGELPSNPACKAFRDKWVPKDEFSLAIKHSQPKESIGVRNSEPDSLALVRARLKKYSNMTTRSIFQSIISDSFELEQDKEFAVLDIGRLLEQQGAEVQLNATTFKAYSDKLMDLVILHKLVHALGMSLYMEEIMGHEIANKFAKAPKATPAKLSHTPEE